MLFLQKKEIYNRPRAVLSIGNLRRLVENKLSGINKPLLTGTDTNKFTKTFVPNMGDDVKIKYKNYNMTTPSLRGESHRFILMGYTEGTTVSYAYINGQPSAPKLTVDENSILNLRTKAIVTVVGGTSSTYTLGVTEILSYATGFRRSVGENVNRIGARGGDLEYELAESGKSVTCSLFITADTDTFIDFGLKDTQSDTKRAWQLEVELDINRVENMGIEYTDKGALYQNSMIILLQDGDYLLWN